MKRALWIVVVLSLTTLFGMQAVADVPPEVLAQIKDDDPNPLPKYLTEEEKLLPMPTPTREDYQFRSPPTGTVYTPSEYELCEGALIRWGSYNSLLTEFTVGVTTGDPEAIVYIVVTGAAQQSSATSTLTSAGADMSQVEYITYVSDTVWIRDYGPRFIFEDGARAIIDHTYNRPRPSDNAFPDFLSSLWGEPQYDIPLTHGGGNFHLFSNGDAFMSDLVLGENSSLSEQDVKDLFSEYQNLDVTIYPGLPTSFDSTQHIDMWMLPVGDYKIIIGEYSPSTGLPYTITEDAVADLTSRGYTVYRTPGWNSGGTHYTYTNAAILNDQVFVPEFGGSYTSQDATALSVFETAMPDHTASQVDCSSIISAAGAIHCVMMHVPGYLPGLRVTPSSGLAASGPAGGPFTPDSIIYTLENTTDDPLDYSVTQSQPWVSLTNPTGTLPSHGTAQVTVSINSNADTLGNGVYEDTVEFVNTTDHNGDTTRNVTLTVGVPELAYSFPLDSNPGWSTEGLWAWGQPTGQGGQYGEPDPTSGYTGSNVYGYNLNGDYENYLSERHLTSTAIDCTNLSDVHLKFWRWLGVEQPTYDHAYVRVSNNGSSWTTVWQNSGTVSDSSWTQQEYDISSIADGEPTVYLRWTMGTTDSGWQYCGWNIDDVEIWAITEAVETCDDGILNQGEDRIDCGGPCPPCECTSDGMCDNGAYCDGTETCDDYGYCQNGTFPCTDPNFPYCDEDDDDCDECAESWHCDDGEFCNGAEACIDGSCQPGDDPCPDQECDEEGDVCISANGDCDDDGDVDLQDFLAFQTCFTGPGGPVDPGCECADFDGDDDVDLQDFLAFQVAFTGPL